MSIREDLATAASSVEGITCHPYFVQTTQAGNAFVRLERIDYPDKFGGVRTWNVVVLLPQDLASAEKYLEAKVPALYAAVAEHVVITSVTPQQLNIPGAGVLLSVFITGQREDD